MNASCSASSAYFNTRVLKSTFKEGQDIRVELEEEDPAISGFLNEYLCTCTSTANVEPADNIMCNLCELWLLAHYGQVSELLSYAICCLMHWRDMEMSKESPQLYPSHDFEDLYEKAPVDSMLRKLLLDYLVWERGSFWLSPEAQT